MIVFFFLFQFIVYILVAYELLLFLTALLSWFPSLHFTKAYRFLQSCSEPFLVPIRKFLYRFEFVRRCPLDLSFMVLWGCVSLLIYVFGILSELFL